MPSSPSPTRSRPPYEYQDSNVSGAKGHDSVDNEDEAQLLSSQSDTSPEYSSYPPLPPGAMAVQHPMGPTFVDLPADPTFSPPSTASQRLLDPDPLQVQFATYKGSTGKELGGEASPRLLASQPVGWVPWPLRWYFWIPLVVVLALGAVGLEIALHFSNKNQGWATTRSVGSETGLLHYVYTLPPVAVAAILAALWTWTDIEIKKMQPYVDLVHGDSPPHRSLLLDYTRTNNFIVWTSAASNKHYLVALATLMVLLSFAFQPLSAALLVVVNTWIQLPDVTLNNLGAIGLNQDPQFQDLTTFVTAAGFASASVLYNLPDPAFIHDQYTIAPFELPRDIVANGTVIANTTAIKSDSGCLPVDVKMVSRNDGSGGWNNSASSNGCAIAWVVEKTAVNLFGTDLPGCSPVPTPQFSPVVFWFFSYDPIPQASATFCFPTISLWDVNVNVDLATGNLTHVTELRPFSSSSNFSSLSANVTGAPLFGHAYNGIRFNLTNPDPFVLQRQSATQLQLPAAVYQAAVQSTQGLQGSFAANSFVDFSTRVYTTYLTLIARNVYFLPDTQPLTVQLKSFQNRVWLSSTAVHLLATAMLLLAFFGSIVHVFHRADRRKLRLRHEPGTIASAVSIGAQTGMGNLLAGRQDEKDMADVLSNKKFRIDPRTMKIIMEGEEGYEFAASPMDRRKSVFATLQAQRGLSKRFSVWSKPSSTPNSPRPKDDV